MNKLKQEIKKIRKSYFTFADLRKVSGLNDASLRVAVSRLVKSGEIEKVAKGYYRLPGTVVDPAKIALEIYRPSYLSFEWALGWYGILSQKSHAITLATAKRAKQVTIEKTEIVYRHIKPEMYFGYILKAEYLIAEPEKAFLDLAYLSLNGYAGFDEEEMNLELLNKSKIKDYLKKINSEKLNKKIKPLFNEKSV